MTTANNQTKAAPAQLVFDGRLLEVTGRKQPAEQGCNNVTGRIAPGKLSVQKSTWGASNKASEQLPRTPPSIAGISLAPVPEIASDTNTGTCVLGVGNMNAYHTGRTVAVQHRTGRQPSARCHQPHHPPRNFSVMERYASQRPTLGQLKQQSIDSQGIGSDKFASEKASGTDKSSVPQLCAEGVSLMLRAMTPPMFALDLEIGAQTARAHRHSPLRTSRSAEFGCFHRPSPIDLDNLQAYYDINDADSLWNEQHRADTWLQEFRTTAESWILCLDLLSNPQAQEPEAYFAANTLRYNCSKSAVVISQDVSAQLFPKLVVCLYDALAKNRWTVIPQLSTALAVLIIRTAAWGPITVITDLEKLMLSQLHLVQPPEQQQITAHMAMLHVLAALPPACTDKHCNVHPNRRNAVSEALAASPHIQPWIQAAFLAHEQQGQQSMLSNVKQTYLTLGMQLVHGWCELGCMPIQLPQSISIIQHICLAALRSETASLASEALVSLINVCKDVAVLGSDTLLLVIQCWQDATTSNAASIASASHSVLQAMCSVLCSAASALLPFSLATDNLFKTQFLRLAEQLMVHLTGAVDDVSLTALQFWQDTYITTLQGLPAGIRQTAIQSHTGILQSLTSGLVLRSQLDPATAVTSTADARDLPDEVRMVRRELASALRDVTSLVGLHSMTQYLAAVVQAQWNHLCTAQNTTAPQAWTPLECALYAANVVLGQQGAARRKESPNTSAVQLLVDISCACVTRAAEVDKSCSPKLLGTALTLLGGLGPWFLEQPDVLSPVLTTLTLALKSSDEKLSRNAATTIYRLCQNSSLAALILSMHHDWVQEVSQMYHRAGGVRQRIGTGNDLPTEEMLLASLCRLAMQPASGNLAMGGNLLLHLTEPKLQELKKAIAGLVACAPIALQMLSASPSMSGSGKLSGHAPQGQQQLGKNNMQLGAISAPATAGNTQFESAIQAEVARAAAHAVQAGLCLDVLHMVIENATNTGKVKDISNQSMGNSMSESPHGGQHSGSVIDSRTNSFSEASRGSSATQPAIAQQDSACADQVLNMVQSVWNITQPHLQQLQCQPTIMSPMCVLFRTAMRSLPSHMQHDVQLCALQLLSCASTRVLVSPKAQALLGVCLDLCTQSNRPSSPQVNVNRGLLNQSQRADCTPTSNPQINPQTLQVLLNVVHNAVIHGCQNAMTQCDPDYTIPTLQMCTTAVKCMPRVLSLQGVIETLVSMTQNTARCYDMGQCTQWLEWTKVFMCAPYGGPRVRTGCVGVQARHLGAMRMSLTPSPNHVAASIDLGSASRGGGFGSVASSPATPQQMNQVAPPAPDPGLAMLAGMLEAGAGAQLVLSMLLAASGDMPPDMVQAIAMAVHAIWQGVGTHRFSSWIERAVFELAPEAAPWYKLKQDTKLASLQELVSPDTEYDVGRFKKLLKSFCGGKKKAGFNSLPGSRSVSRSSSTLSALHLSS